MESKVCSRSHGQPPGARRRAIIPTAREKASWVDADCASRFVSALDIESMSNILSVAFRLRVSRPHVVLSFYDHLASPGNCIDCRPGVWQLFKRMHCTIAKTPID